MTKESPLEYARTHHIFVPLDELHALRFSNLPRSTVRGRPILGEVRPRLTTGEHTWCRTPEGTHERFSTLNLIPTT